MNELLLKQLQLAMRELDSHLTDCIHYTGEPLRESAVNAVEAFEAFLKSTDGEEH